MSTFNWKLRNFNLTTPRWNVNFNFNGERYNVHCRVANVLKSNTTNRFPNRSRGDSRTLRGYSTIQSLERLSSTSPSYPRTFGNKAGALFSELMRSPRRKGDGKFNLPRICEANFREARREKGLSADVRSVDER